MSTAHRPLGKLEQPRGFGEAESIPVDETDDFSIEGVERLQRGMNGVRFGAWMVGGAVAVGEFEAEPGVECAAPLLGTSVGGQHSSCYAVHPHSCFGVVAWQGSLFAPQNQECLVEEVSGVFRGLDSAVEVGQKPATLLSMLR